MAALQGFVWLKDQKGRDDYCLGKYGMTFDEYRALPSDVVDYEEEIEEEYEPYQPETRDGFDDATWDFFGTLKAREQIYKEQNTARN